MNGSDSGDKERSTSALGVLHEMLSEEIRKLRTADDWTRWLKTVAAFHHYSFRNAVLIAAQKPDATVVGDMSMWRHLGRHVPKDEKPVRIFAPIFSRSINDAGVVTRPTYHDLVDDSEAAKSGRGRRLVGFRVAHVWDVSQTAGEPLPKLARSGPVPGSVPVGLWDGLITCFEREGYELSAEPAGEKTPHGSQTSRRAGSDLIGWAKDVRSRVWPTTSRTSCCTILMPSSHPAM